MAGSREGGHVTRRGAWIVLGAGLSGCCLVLSAAAYLGWRILDTPMAVADAGEWLEVPSGTPLTRVTTELGDRDILSAPWVLSAYARVLGDATRIHAGEYQIKPDTTPRELLQQLVGGEVFLYQLTVVEGWRYEELLGALQGHEAIDSSDLLAESVMAALGKAETHPEGQFFPDTYRFPRGTPALDVLRQAHVAMESQLATAWSGYRATSVLETAYDALILASIVEKETALAAERQRIAGVFHRRLERGMRLQTDPTVIYGLGAAFDGNLRRGDLGRDTPYNTYTRAGLPPTPIALPGGDALTAAVNPDPGPELYFVATGLGDGSHTFSTTLEEHEEAVGRYLDRLRNRPPESN